MPYLLGGVVFVVIGTYFLFSQLSVYVIRVLKKKDTVFFNKTNLLTISELAYRMKDNATMFFMLAIVSAVAFTGIGTCLAMGNKGLTEIYQSICIYLYFVRRKCTRRRAHYRNEKTTYSLKFLLSGSGYESKIHGK